MPQVKHEYYTNARPHTNLVICWVSEARVQIYRRERNFRLDAEINIGLSANESIYFQARHGVRIMRL